MTLHAPAAEKARDTWSVEHTEGVVEVSFVIRGFNPDLAMAVKVSE